MTITACVSGLAQNLINLADSGSTWFTLVVVMLPFCKSYDNLDALVC